VAADRSRQQSSNQTGCANWWRISIAPITSTLRLHADLTVCLRSTHTWIIQVVENLKIFLYL
jgi:hypothetical protein